ncbi:oxidoreductase [Herbiconiux sp. P16]|uniref:oxidoreductase n=1 Tax=Herbiconiux wuyangfengii TaxID=3342794 RepID=UPI0035B6D9C6
MSSHSSTVAFITGASSGIGLAIAKRLAADGYVVVGTSRRARPVSDDGIEYVALDVTDDASIRAAIEGVVEKHGRIDILINNAGVGLSGAAEESSRAQLATLFDTNLLGLAEVTNNVLPVMRRQRSGRIVNISSVFGFAPAPNLAMYAASKFAVEGYSESLAHELLHFGIRVAIVEPGITTSNFDANIVIADKPLSVYDSARDAAAVTYSKTLENADDPKVVVDTVMRAITAKNPKLRYPAGKLTRQLTTARRLLPEKAFSRVVRSANNLPAVPSR